MHSDFHGEILRDPYFLEENLGPEFQMLNIENSILHLGKSLSSFSNIKWKECHSQARKSVSTFSYMKYTAIIFSVGIIVPDFHMARIQSRFSLTPLPCFRTKPSCTFSSLVKLVSCTAFQFITLAFISAEWTHLPGVWSKGQGPIIQSECAHTEGPLNPWYFSPPLYPFLGSQVPTWFLLLPS